MCIMHLLNWQRTHRNRFTENATSTTDDDDEDNDNGVGKERQNKVKTAYKIKYVCPQAISSIFARLCRLINWFQCVWLCTQFCAYFVLLFIARSFSSWTVQHRGKSMSVCACAFQRSIDRLEYDQWRIFIRKNSLSTENPAIFGFDLDAF